MAPEPHQPATEPLQEALQKLLALAGERGDVTREKVAEAVAPIDAEQLPALMASLTEAFRNQERAVHDETSRITERAGAEAQLLRHGLPDHMADYYDGEVRAAHRDLGSKHRFRQEVVSHLEEIIQERQG